jgi:type III pantothenate kinase
MNLVIDIGNSLAKVALTENDSIINLFRYETLNADILSSIIEKYHPENAIISSVGKVDESLFKQLNSLVPLTIHNSSTKIPIINRYKTPNTLGLDRIAAVVGANYLYPSTDILVIDSGTAITYDLINSKGEYFGGAISPGILLRYKSLHQNTANLPLLSSFDNNSLIGTNTTECIESGVLNGVIGEVDFYINQIKLEFPSVMVVFAGGDSNFFVNKLKNSIFVVQNLVIIGLNRILDFNAKH